MKKSFLFIFSLLSIAILHAQNIWVYPTNWWIGMKWNNVQLLIRSADKSISQEKVTINYPGVVLKKISKFDNPHYLALDVFLSPGAKPGIVKINLSGKTIDWPLQKRRTGNGRTFANGATSADVMYLIMPDRFSNGDYSNDKIPGMKDQSLRRDTVFNRHGGDLQGVQNHLDYLQELGVTAIWLNPVIENDMPDRTEHGYAFTDHYKIDPRIGGEKAYKSLIDAAHKKGLKMIQDAVYNHVGLEHFLFRDQPDSTWFHRWPRFTQTNYKDQTVFDPYGSKIDKKIMQDGWFVPSMPDWDQSNPFVENFLIQHAIWTVEEFGIDGWRIDTYAYNDLNFMNRCNKALYDEYPRISIFGETWVHGVPNQSYFCQNNYNIPFKSNLQATTDFQTSALAWLLTSRGIPQMYYGNEILMTGFTSPNDGHVRLDFPGGWKEDKENKFTASGRTAKENAIFNYIKRLANFRKNSSAIKTGKLMQFYPIDGVYVYFRYDNQQTIMCAMNTNEKPATIDLARFKERLQGFKNGREIVSYNKITLADSLKLTPMSNLVLELGN